MASFYGPDATVHPRGRRGHPRPSLSRSGQRPRGRPHPGQRGHRRPQQPRSRSHHHHPEQRLRRGSEGSAFSRDRNGQRALVRDRIGRAAAPDRHATRQLESPVLQAQNNARSVEESLMALAPLGVWVKTLRIYSYVVIPFPSATNQVDYHGGPVRVVQGIDAFLKSVVDREYPVRGPAGLRPDRRSRQSLYRRIGAGPVRSHYPGAQRPARAGGSVAGPACTSARRPGSSSCPSRRRA